MLKYLVIVIFALSSCSQNKTQVYQTVPESSLVLDKSKGVFLWEGTLFNGSTIKKFPSDTIARVIPYKNGKKHGAMVLFFKNGDSSYVANYKNGELHGRIASWWHNGLKKTESNYSQGKVNGAQKRWYQSGARHQLLNFTKGKEDGLQQEWNEKGNLINNYENKNGRIYGLKSGNPCYKIENEEIQF